MFRLRLITIVERAHARFLFGLVVLLAVPFFTTYKMKIKTSLSLTTSIP